MKSRAGKDNFPPLDPATIDDELIRRVALRFVNGEVSERSRSPRVRRPETDGIRGARGNHVLGNAYGKSRSRLKARHTDGES